MVVAGSGIAARSTKDCFPNATERIRGVAFFFIYSFKQSVRNESVQATISFAKSDQVAAIFGL